MTQLEARSGATYTLDPEPLAVGGEAVVYRATDEDDGSVVALKVALHPGPALHRVADRLEALSADPHAGPAIVGVWDRGFWDDRAFVVMDLLPGTLRDVVNAHPARRLAACRALVGAVSRLHRVHAVHGDLKPSNALVPDLGEHPPVVLLTDPLADGIGHSPSYSPPERDPRAPASASDDRYALAVSVVELLTHAVPAGALAPHDRQALRAAGATDALVAVLARSLAHAPGLRPTSLQPLDDALWGRAPRPRPRWRPPLAAAALLAAAPLSTAIPPCPTGFSAHAERCLHLDGRGLRWVPAGRFDQGDPEAADAPIRSVFLTRGLWLGLTETTQAQWAAIAGERPTDRTQVLDGGVEAPCDHWHGHSVAGDGLPVVCVSWTDVARWLNAASERDHLDPVYAFDGDRVTRIPGAVGWRLPTEAEWERAATLSPRHPDPCVRANTRDLDAPEYWGNEAPCHDGDPVLAAPAHVDASGFFDLEGNALEWVEDIYGPYGGDANDPTGPLVGASRVLRGGSWNHVPHGPGWRYAGDPAGYAWSIGFRIAIDASP